MIPVRTCRNWVLIIPEVLIDNIIIIRACHRPTLIGPAGVEPGRLARRGQSILDITARPVNVSKDGPRPEPAHNIFDFSRHSLARPLNF